MLNVIIVIFYLQLVEPTDVQSPWTLRVNCTWEKPIVPNVNVH